MNERYTKGALLKLIREKEVEINDLNNYPGKDQNNYSTGYYQDEDLTKLRNELAELQTQYSQARNDGGRKYKKKTSTKKRRSTKKRISKSRKNHKK